MHLFDSALPLALCGYMVAHVASDLTHTPVPAVSDVMPTEHHWQVAVVHAKQSLAAEQSTVAGVGDDIVVIVGGVAVVGGGGGVAVVGGGGGVAVVGGGGSGVGNCGSVPAMTSLMQFVSSAAQSAAGNGFTEQSLASVGHLADSAPHTLLQSFMPIGPPSEHFWQLYEHVKSINACAHAAPSVWYARAHASGAGVGPGATDGVGGGAGGSLIAAQTVPVCGTKLAGNLQFFG